MGFVFWVFLWGAGLSAFGEERLWTLEVQVAGQILQGYPAAWDDRQVQLLTRDGRWCSFPLDRLEKFRKISDRFLPYSVSEFRSELLRELGADFEISTTAHYILAYPKGRSSHWAERLEDLYRAMVRYFSVRNFTLEEPRFPLVAVLCRDQGQLAHFAAAEKRASGEKLLGFYSPRSNRMYFCDLPPTGVNRAILNATGQTPWDDRNRTLVHEAFHQIAFNTGLYHRFSPPPVWLAEGLAMMFESPGVWQANSLPHLKDRVHPFFLQQYRKRFSKDSNPAWLERLIRSDDMFQTETAEAYAAAWALTFFLMETHPRPLAEYLQKTASRPPFQPYPSEQRLHDFKTAFGVDLRMMLSRMNRFLDNLP